MALLLPTIATSANEVTEELSGTIDGNNRVFTISQTPLAGSVKVFKNGLLQFNSGSGDYTLSGLTVTFVVGNAPIAGDVLTVAYLR